MYAWLCLFIWVPTQTLQLMLGLRVPFGSSAGGSPRQRAALFFSAAASALPLVTLILFFRVFLIGGSSNIAQHAGESGLDLWSLWFHAWPLLFFGNPSSFVAAIAALALPPYPPKYTASFAYRVCAVIASVCA